MAQLLEWLKETPGVVWFASAEREQERNREMRTEVWCSFQRSLMLSQIPAGGLDKNMRGSPTFETLLRVTQSSRL